jgi:hypothetical protein
MTNPIAMIYSSSGGTIGTAMVKCKYLEPAWKASSGGTGDINMVCRKHNFIWITLFGIKQWANLHSSPAADALSLQCLE